MDLNEYYDELCHHDWFYSYSDDHRVWKRGHSREAFLRAIAQESEEHKRLWEQFNNYAFSGPGFGTEKAPKPVRPGAGPEQQTDE